MFRPRRCLRRVHRGRHTLQLLREAPMKRRAMLCSSRIISPTSRLQEICVNAKGKSDHHVESEPKPIPLALSATGELCSFQAAKAAALSIVDTEQGEVGAIQVARKGDYQFAIRFVASFLDRRYCEEVGLRYDNEPGIVQLAEKVRAFRHP